MEEERNIDGTIGAEHVTDTGRPLRAGATGCTNPETGEPISDSEFIRRFPACVPGPVLREARRLVGHRRFQVRIRRLPPSPVVWQVGYAKWHRPPLRIDAFGHRVWIGWG